MQPNNHLQKRKFEDYTTNVYPPAAQDAHQVDFTGLSGSGSIYAQHHPIPPQQHQHQPPALHPLAPHHQALGAPSQTYAEPPQDPQPPQLPVAGKAKKPRKPREKKPRKDRKKKEEDTRPKVQFRGSRFELWLETRFEEELLKLFKVPTLQLSANLVNGTATVAPGASWEMARSDEERIYKDKWRKRYHVYTALVGDLVGDTFNFHVRAKNAATGEYHKLPFITPDKVTDTPLSSYSNYLSLLGGAHINPVDDHCGYPPGELIGEDACTLYEGSDVSFVLVGKLAGVPAASNGAGGVPAAPPGIQQGGSFQHAGPPPPLSGAHVPQQAHHQPPPSLHLPYPPLPSQPQPQPQPHHAHLHHNHHHHQGVPTDGNHP